jgi:hypothetical protein
MITLPHRLANKSAERANDRTGGMMTVQQTPQETLKATVNATPKGAWKITFLLFLFMLVNFADKIVVGLAGSDRRSSCCIRSRPS